MTEVSVWTKGAPEIRAEMFAPGQASDQRAFSEMAVDALVALGDGLFEPLAVNVTLAYCHAELGFPLGEPAPAEPFRQLRRAGVPPQVRVPQIWTDVVITEADRLDREAILGWLTSLLVEHASPQPEMFTGWTEMRVPALRARLPRGITVEEDLLRVSYGNGTIRYPVEEVDGGLWVSGPYDIYSDAVPFTVRIDNEGGYLSLDWSLTWSPWIDDDGPGHPAVNAALDRLTALGWTVAPED